MIRFGVIGAGRIGKVHSKTIASNPKAKLAYIADAMPLAAERPAPTRATVWRLFPINSAAFWTASSFWGATGSSVLTVLPQRKSAGVGRC